MKTYKSTIGIIAIILVIAYVWAVVLFFKHPPKIIPTKLGTSVQSIHRSSEKLLVSAEMAAYNEVYKPTEEVAE